MSESVISPSCYTASNVVDLTHCSFLAYFSPLLTYFWTLAHLWVIQKLLLLLLLLVHQVGGRKRRNWNFVGQVQKEPLTSLKWNNLRPAITPNILIFFFLEISPILSPSSWGGNDSKYPISMILNRIQVTFVRFGIAVPDWLQALP